MCKFCINGSTHLSAIEPQSSFHLLSYFPPLALESHFPPSLTCVFPFKLNLGVRSSESPSHFQSWALRCFHSCGAGKHREGQRPKHLLHSTELTTASFLNKLLTRVTVPTWSAPRPRLTPSQSKDLGSPSRPSSRPRQRALRGSQFPEH